MKQIPNEVIFSVMRVLKKVNPGDLYYENYLWHYQKNGEKFFDIYHLAWAIAIEKKPKRILEIGTRTGISLCQLLSAYVDYKGIERIVSCDLFNDGYISPGLVKLNLKTLNIPQDVIDKIEFLIGDSKTLIPQLKEKFDWVLVDGDHSELGARTDLENARTLVEQGGVLVFDDIAPDGMSLLPIWEEFKNNHLEEFEWFQNLDGKGCGWAIKK